MLSIEEGKIQSGGYIALSETTLAELDMVAPVLGGEDGRLSAATERVLEIGRNCGRIIAASCDIEACEAIRSELTANMQENIAMGFSMGFVGGVRFEKQIPVAINNFDTSLVAA